MSTATEISRLQTARNTIRNKMIELGLGTSTDLLDSLAQEIDNIQNRGAVNATVKEGESYTIPAGYHNGAGTVTGVAGGGNYSLQAKSATPTKQQQSITPDSGYYGLSGVTVAAIPAAYQDVTSVTATAADVLANKIIVDAEGSVIAGTMTNNGAIARTLNTTTTSTTIPAGYHNGNGSVSITLEQKSATPTKSAQTVTPTAGKVLSQVSVAAIPDAYQDVTNVTATAETVLEGSVFVDATGEEVEGTVPIIDASSVALNTTTTSYTIPEGYHDGTGTVSASYTSIGSSDPVVPTKSAQTITDSTGKFLSSVYVDPIPDNYIDTGDATATAGEILYSKTAYVDGDLLTGTMANNGATGGTISAKAGTVTIPAGYTSGGTVSISSTEQAKIVSGNIKSGVSILGVSGSSTVVDTSVASADEPSAGNIIEGKKAYVNGSLVTGTMPDNDATGGTISVKAGTVTIPAGYTSGGTVSISSTEQAKIISDNIKSGVTLLGVSGSSTVIDTAVERAATAGQILEGKYAYANGELLQGTMPYNEPINTKISTKAQTVTVNNGYYEMRGSVSIASTEQAKIISGNIKSGVTILGVTGSSSVVDTSDADAVAANILDDKTAYVGGSKVTGTMPNNGAIVSTMDGLTTTSVTIAAGYTSGGTVSLTDDIEQALAAI